MQDCYAGDIGDYGKIALLRELHGQGLCIGVNWYKTDTVTSEKQENGKYCIPDHLSVYDRDAPTQSRFPESRCEWYPELFLRRA